MLKKFFTVLINGQKAVDAGYSFNNGGCCADITNSGKRLGQLEVVVDEEGDEEGVLNKWVSVAYIQKGEDVETVLNILKKQGFDGCPCVICKEIEKNCFATQKSLCCCLI